MLVTLGNIFLLNQIINNINENKFRKPNYINENANTRRSQPDLKSDFSKNISTDFLNKNNKKEKNSISYIYNKKMF